jgi:RNA polymerase sigma-70 factor (ECF subfamily)
MTPDLPTPGSAPTQDALLERLRAGDEAAFAELVKTHHRRIWSFVRRHVPSATIADEVTQDTWLAVVAGLPRFEGRSSLESWIYAIAFRRACTWAVREHRSLPMSALEQPEGAPSLVDRRADAAPHQRGYMTRAPWTEPSERLEVLEVRRGLHRALASLPERYRTVLALSDVEGRKADEVASMMGSTPLAHRVLLHRARRRARAALEDAGIRPAVAAA